MKETPMQVHPKSRPIFFDIPLIGVLKKHFAEMDIDVDLSNNTNPFLGTLGNYPDLVQKSLKQYYWQVISSINQPIDYASSEIHQTIDQHILFTVGSSEGIDLLLRSFAEPNKDIIAVTQPSFPAYEHWGRLHNLQIKRFKLKGANYNQLDVNDIIKENPKLVFLCNPNNPTATLLDPEIIYKLCDSIDGFVIVDEAYIEFSSISSAIYDLPRFNNLIVLRTLSKAWGLAGVRCGAVIAADPLVINTLRYIQIPFGFPTPSQELVAHRCSFPQAMIASWEQVRQERIHLIKKLSSLRAVKKITPSDINFFLMELNHFSTVISYLNQHKIHVVSCDNEIANSIRVSVGTTEENQKFLEAMTLISDSLT